MNLIPVDTYTTYAYYSKYAYDSYTIYLLLNICIQIIVWLVVLNDNFLKAINFILKTIDVMNVKVSTIMKNI